MMFEFNTTELKVFRSICDGKSTARDIASSTRLALPTVYRTIERLSEKRLVATRKAVGSRFLPETRPHAVAMKNFLLSRQRPIESIVGPRLQLLLSLSVATKNLDRLAEETLINISSLRVYTWQLRNLGAVIKTPKGFRLSPSDIFMRSFLDDYSKGACSSVLESKAPQGVLLWNRGLEFIFSAGTLRDPEGVEPTGITGMSSFGLKFTSNTYYYHWAYWHPSLGAEEIALHNAIINPTNPNGAAYSVLLMHRAQFDRKKFVQTAAYLGAEDLASRLMGLLDGKEYPDEHMPTQAQLKELFLLYEGDHA